jgi:hypothetical protein
MSQATDDHRVTGSTTSVMTPTAASTTAVAGRSRRTRRAQNRLSRSRPVRPISRSISPVMRKPEMTKNTSTPTNPPDMNGRPAWNPRTASTATARSPWMSPLNRCRAPDEPDVPVARRFVVAGAGGGGGGTGGTVVADGWRIWVVGSPGLRRGPVASLMTAPV